MNMKNKTILLIFFIIIIILVLYLSNNADNINNGGENKQYSNIKQNLLSIPIDIYIIKYDDKSLSSARDKENINEVFNNVNAIWTQANINVDIKKVEDITVNDASYYYDLNSLLSYMVNSGNHNQSRINAYYAKTLHGSNGIAFPGNVIMVADRTSVYDFRATSHEIGHILGLKHVGPINRLMARGVNGFELIEQEINIARKNALVLFSDN